MVAKITTILPLLMASFLIVLVLVMGGGEHQYSTSVSQADLTDGRIYRLEGNVERLSMEGKKFRFDLCDDGICVPSTVSAQLRILADTRVIVDGKLQNGVFSVSRILTRCDYHSK